MIKKLITILLFSIISLTSVQFACAQRGIDPALRPENLPQMEETGNYDKETCEEYFGEGAWDEKTKTCPAAVEEPINAFLQVIGGALLMLSGGIAVIVFAYGGVQYVISQGNQEKIDKAKKTLLYGTIGIIVVTFSYFIVSFVIGLVIGQV